MSSRTACAHSEFQVNLSYRVRPYHKQANKPTNKNKPKSSGEWYNDILLTARAAMHMLAFLSQTQKNSCFSDLAGSPPKTN